MRLEDSSEDDDSMAFHFVKPSEIIAGITCSTCRDLLPRQTRRVSGINMVRTLLGVWIYHCLFVYSITRHTRIKAMDFEEPVQNTVDPEVRAYVYSLVSAVSGAFAECFSS